MVYSKKIFLWIGFSGILLFSCKTNYQVIHVTKDAVADNKSGFYYTLPQTLIKVNFTVNQQENIKGPYSDYAKKYFGLNNVITQNSTTYNISDIKTDTYSSPDSSQYYFVETNDSKLGLIVNRLGIIETVNPADFLSVKHEKYTGTDSTLINPKADYPELFKMFADLSLYEKVDTIFTKRKIDSVYKNVRIDTLFTLEKTFKTSIVEKPTEQKVKEIADLISKIKDNRFSLLIGDLEVNDKKSIEFMYAELQNLENEYMKLFTGITLNHTLSYSYIYLPEKDTNTNITKEILCKFSSEKGMLDKQNPFGENIYIQLVDNKINNAVQLYNLQKGKIQKGKHGFYHRMPAYADVNIIYNNKFLHTSKQLIAQLGLIISLPINKSYLQYDEKTGAIRKIQIK